METSNPKCTREIVSAAAPCRFIDKTKKLFDEIREKQEKFKDKNIDFDVGSARNEEYYKLIDSSVQDQDALDLLQLRRYLREQIHEAQAEVQEDLKKHFTKEIEDESNKLSKPDGKDNVRKIKTDTTTRIPPKSNLLKVRSTQPHLNVSVRNSIPKSVPRKNEPTQSALQHDNNNRTLQQKTLSDKDINFTYLCEDKNEESLMLSQKLSEKIQNVFSRAKQPRTGGHYVNENDKYFPCAVPLGPPSRQKTDEIIPPSEPICQLEVNKITSDVKQKDDAVPITKSLPTVTKSKTVFLATPNVSRPVSRNNLTIEILPSINIIGKPRPTTPVNSKLFCFQSEDTNNKNESPEISTVQASLDIRNCDIPSPQSQYSGQRFTTTQLSGILNALNRCRTEMHTERMQLDRMQIENLVTEIVQQNMQKDAIFETEKGDSVGKRHDKVNTGTQASEIINFRREVATVSTQTEHKSIASNDKAEQAAHVIQLDHISTQTEVQGNINEESVIPKTENDNFHKCCSCIISKDIFSEMKTARTSTPIDFEFQTLPEKKSQGTNTGASFKELDVVHVSVTKRNETCDAHTSTIFNQECQTIPETRDVPVQYENPENMVCCGTMTAEISSRDVSIQLELPEGLSEFPDVHLGIDMKNVAVQSDLLDLSLSSTTTVTSENDFMDDLLSEGEIHLPWNLRLLSLIERGIIPRNVTQSLDSSGALSKVTDEPSLSEGEIPPKYLLGVDPRTKGSQSVASNTSAILCSSDSSGMEAVPQASGYDRKFSGSQLSSLKSDLSDGQVPNPFLLRPDSVLSSDVFTSGGDDPSDTEFASSKRLPSAISDMPTILPDGKEASTSSESIPRPLPSLPSTSLPETKHSILDSSTFRSFLHTASELSPSTLKQNDDDVNRRFKFTSPSLEKYLSDIRPAIAKSPDLKTVTEEESKEGTESKSEQVSSGDSLMKHGDGNFHSTSSS